LIGDMAVQGATIEEIQRAVIEAHNRGQVA
jgi:hypothetical protein